MRMTVKLCFFLRIAFYKFVDLKCYLKTIRIDFYKTESVTPYRDSLFFDFPQVLVEGNIGVGKTTFLNFLQSKTSNVEVFPEPVNLWKDVGGYNALVGLFIQ